MGPRAQSRTPKIVIRALGNASGRVTHKGGQLNISFKSSDNGAVDISYTPLTSYRPHGFIAHFVIHALAIVVGYRLNHHLDKLPVLFEAIVQFPGFGA